MYEEWQKDKNTHVMPKACCILDVPSTKVSHFRVYIDTVAKKMIIYYTKTNYDEKASHKNLCIPPPLSPS